MLDMFCRLERVIHKVIRHDTTLRLHVGNQMRKDCYREQTNCRRIGNFRHCRKSAAE